MPHLAQWNTNVLYPLCWPCLLFPLPWSLNFVCLAHLVLAGLGMYFLAARWTHSRFGACVAGLAYALNGFSFNALMWTGTLAALAWMPFVILFVERAWQEGRKFLLAAVLASTLQMLSGSPEIILLTWLLVGSLWLCQLSTHPAAFSSSAKRLVAVVALVCGLAAVQLLPFFELVRYCDRDSGATGGAWTMPPWGLGNFLVPLFRCSPPLWAPVSRWNSNGPLPTTPASACSRWP